MTFAQAHLTVLFAGWYTDQILFLLRNQNRSQRMTLQTDDGDRISPLAPKTKESHVERFIPITPIPLSIRQNTETFTTITTIAKTERESSKSTAKWEQAASRNAKFVSDLAES